MIDEKIVLRFLEEDFQEEKDEYKDHVERAQKAVSWFNENLVDKEATWFVGNKIISNGVECMCTKANLKKPFAFFEVRPMQSTQDAGSGINGGVHTITF